MKRLILAAIYALNLSAFACWVSPGGPQIVIYGDGGDGGSGDGPTITIGDGEGDDNVNFGDSQVSVGGGGPSGGGGGGGGGSESTAPEVAFPAPFDLNITRQNPSRPITRVMLQIYRDSAWVTIGDIVNPKWNVSVGRAVPLFGKYPLSNRLGVADGETFWLRVYISDGVSESLTLTESFEVNNPWYFQLKKSTNHRPY